MNVIQTLYEVATDSSIKEYNENLEYAAAAVGEQLDSDLQKPM